MQNDMRLSFIGNQKAEGVSDLQLFYSYFWRWEGLTPQASCPLLIPV